jgi:hypothetical protein
MNTITIDVDSRLVRIVRSPAFSVVASLRGVCVSFAPAFLYWSGQGKFFHGYERFIVPACFAVIFLVPLVYFRLGNAVIKELKNRERQAPTVRQSPPVVNGL